MGKQKRPGLGLTAASGQEAGWDSGCRPESPQGRIWPAGPKLGLWQSSRQSPTTSAQQHPQGDHQGPSVSCLSHRPHPARPCPPFPFLLRGTPLGSGLGAQTQKQSEDKGFSRQGQAPHGTRDQAKEKCCRAEAPKLAQSQNSPTAQKAPASQTGGATSGCPLMRPRGQRHRVPNRRGRCGLRLAYFFSSPFSLTLTHSLLADNNQSGLLSQCGLFPQKKTSK